MSYCVLYSYFETTNSKKNLAFFVKNGLHNNTDVVFVFIINGHQCSVTIPAQDNIKIMYKDNGGHDFGSWAHGLRTIRQDDFDYFIFMNDTVCGPFLPRYVPHNVTWYSMFTCLLSDTLKLSGLSINYFPWEKRGDHLQHVQSMMFCTDKQGLQLLNDNIFHLTCDEYDTIYHNNRKEFIIQFEIGMSQLIIKNGFNIGALYMCDVDRHQTGDVWYNNKYFESTINPFEVMFIKSNRVRSDIIQFYYSQFMK